ncbi:ParA family protein [Vibrio mediterranei]|uniref:ParA family protein n=1 Tax=Vibrio mediterranei TaxID=689 RepID=UPI00148CB4F8|nr:ParA family protein [Vibrio mediterranei]NOH31558.1 ParA family protein [Vibrio mediterranei]
MAMLAKYDKIGSNAKDSLIARQDLANYLRDEISERIYSQADVVTFLKHTDKPFSKTKVDDAMKAMHASGEREFYKTPSGYKLSYEDVMAIGEHLGVTQYRAKHGGRAFVISFLNLKGGVGKSLCTNMLAHYFTYSERYLLSAPRILIIDLDPQGTSTQQNKPIYKIADHEYTSLLTLVDEMSLEEIQANAIKTTEHRNLDIMMCGTEDGFYADSLNSEEVCQDKYVGTLLTDRLIKKIEHLYDLILIDVGPHMDDVLKNCLWSANQILVPTPPTFYSYDSTLRFLERLPNVMRELVENGKDESKLADITAFLTKIPIQKARGYDKDIFETASKDLAKIFELDNIKHELPLEDAYERCAENGHTIFSLPKKDYTGDKRAFQRALDSATDWAKELADLIETKQGVL